MKTIGKKYLAGLSAALLVALACQTTNTTGPDQSHKLVDLRQIDDFPLYVAHYDGDYPLPLNPQLEPTAPVAAAQTVPRSAAGWACTCFAALDDENNVIVGRNFDWHDHPALLLFTRPPGRYASVSMVDISYLGYDMSDDPMENSGNLDDAPLLPFDGMNEHGLAVGMMAVDQADPPAGQGRTPVNSLMVIRLVLDYAKTVDEAIAIFQQVTIDFSEGPPLHYLIADATGKSAVIELVQGRESLLFNEDPWQVSTNFVITGKTADQAIASCWRYKTAWQALEASEGRISESEALQLLSDVSQSSTIWSVVYNSSTKGISVSMGRDYDRVHRFEDLFCNI